MKALSVLFAVLSLTIVPFGFSIPARAQAEDARLFFPSDPGNRWMLQTLVSKDTFRFAIHRDSIDEIGRQWLWTSSGPMMLDTNDRVYVNVRPEDDPQQILRYNLRANVGESWTVISQPEFSSAQRAYVRDVTTGTLFGEETTVKMIEYYQFFTDNPNDSIWYETDYLAKGFGLVRWDVEPGASYLIRGMVISGRTYGDISSVPEERSSPAMQFSLAPNPAGTHVRLLFDTSLPYEAEIRITDVLGRVLHISSIPEHGPRTIELPTDHLAPGVYVCTVTTSRSVASHTFVKQ